MFARASTARLPVAVAIGLAALLCLACGGGQPAATPATTATRPAASVSGPISPPSSQPLAARQSSPPQTPADHPLVDAEAPDLPPQAGSLQPVQVAVPDGVQGAPQGRSLNLPAGFTASVYAVTGGGPRFMALGPDGAVYVALMNRGQVVRLDDQGGYATPTTVLDGLNQPSSL